MDSLHPIQFTILRELLFRPLARFSNLNVTELTNDHFTFHIKRLQELGFVTKSSHGYTLTPPGKEFANRLDTATTKLERQAKSAVLIICSRHHSHQLQYLIQQRLKQPYYGFHGFMTGKIRWGETTSEAAARELAEETRLTGKPTLVGTKHKMDYDQSQTLLEDKFFYVFHVPNPQGHLQDTFAGGRNFWLSQSELLRLPLLFDGVEESLSMTRNRRLSFIETKYTVRNY